MKGEVMKEMKPRILLICSGSVATGIPPVKKFNKYFDSRALICSVYDFSRFIKRNIYSLS